MKRPSSIHLSHDFLAYKGLSLRELLMVTVITTGSVFILSLLVGLLFGYAVLFGGLGFLVGFIVAITVVPSPIARLKAGKPEGHLKKQMMIGLGRFKLMQSPYLRHQGSWRKSRSIEVKDV